MSRLLVTQYQAEVEKIIRYGGSKKETSIRNAFERLLNDYCKPRNYLLIPELDFKTKFNTTVFPASTVKDAIRLEHGWWESYGLTRVDKGRKGKKGDASVQGSLLATDEPAARKPSKRTTPKPKLKADKTDGKIILDTETTLEGVRAVAWDYKLGNRSALEWILNQYKEKKPKDPMIAKLFNT